MSYTCLTNILWTISLCLLKTALRCICTILATASSRWARENLVLRSCSILFQYKSVSFEVIYKWTIDIDNPLGPLLEYAFNSGRQTCGLCCVYMKQKLCIGMGGDRSPKQRLGILVDMERRASHMELFHATSIRTLYQLFFFNP